MEENYNELEEFFASETKDEWNWSGKYDEKFYSISNGRLKLNAVCTKDNKLENISNILYRKIKCPIDIKAKVKLKLSENGDMAGISIFNDSRYVIKAEKCDDNIYIKQSEYDKDCVNLSDERVCYSSKIRSESDIYFEIKINEDKKITFYFGYSADDIYKIGYVGECNKNKELNIGIFCINSDKESTGYVKFEYVRFY